MAAMVDHGDDGPSDALTGAVDYPLYVVTAASDDEVSGCLAGFVTQSSMDPVQFLICISKVNHTYPIAQRSRGLALHVLGSDQHDVASLFGERTGDTADKFEQVAWTRGDTGVPILSECAAWLEGRIVGRMSGGDHEAFLITVDDVARRQRLQSRAPAVGRDSTFDCPAAGVAQPART
jgi:flavin reductase (DIM6/NTAB) family NADH-FMN oxidoreductase RutF